MRENKEGGYKNKHKKRVALNHSAIKGGPAKITCKLVGQYYSIPRRYSFPTYLSKSFLCFPFT